MRSKYNILLTAIVFVLGCFFITSASIFNTPNYSRAKKDLVTDMSGYYDFLIKKCELPDGKIADVYIFNNIYDQIAWQNVQSRAYSKDWKRYAEKCIKQAEKYDEDTSYYKWNPTGPLTPFYRQWGNLEEKYGSADAANKICIGASPVSYYKREELGQLSEYMKTLDCAAQACYEDSEGVYLLTIVKTKYIPQSYIVSNKMKKLHKDEFVYEVGFIPKEMYKEDPIKLDPAKTEPYDPSIIPDSDLNLVPVISTSKGEYYYSEEMATKLQWLAVKIACKGIYDMAYTGNFYAKNPNDYYKTSFIKKYLANDDGKTSRGTLLFEGICFDYAEFAYQEVSAKKSDYLDITRYWMVSTFTDSSDIVLYKVAETGEIPDMTINTTPVVVFAHQHVLAHDAAKNHAWLWLQSSDGTIYWIDPTWTDNTGRPVYGIVRGGKEIQLDPDKRFFAK